MAKTKGKASKKNFNELCNPDCPIRKSMNILDGKWTMLVLRDLLNGPQRFGELRRTLGDINPKTLTDRLRYLERMKVISKKIYPEIPPRVEYSLTKKGAALKPVLNALAVWGSEWE